MHYFSGKSTFKKLILFCRISAASFFIKLCCQYNNVDVSRKLNSFILHTIYRSTTKLYFIYLDIYIPILGFEPTDYDIHLALLQ